MLKTAGGRSPHAVTEVEHLLDAEGGELNPEQRDAVRNALNFSISLMTGGAGSGKTYAVSTIASIAERLELKVVLAAPTGKAAKRLEEVVGHEASTIHRLLGFNGHTYSRDALNPIEADILVVDEVSMMDVPLAWRLFQAVDRTRTAVVLVGDHNQLPPVGPGNLLRDLVRSMAIPTTVLTRIIRQAGVLKENSTAILTGEVRPTSDSFVGARRPWYVIDKFTDREDVRRMLLLLFEEVLQERLGYDLIREVQVLTPTHKGPLGTVELNIELQRLLQHKLFGVDVPTVEAGHRARPYPGDKVIQTKNDYELGVMNGAMGVVVDATPDGGLSDRFRWPAGRDQERQRCARQYPVGLRDVDPQSAGIGISLRGRDRPQVAFLHAPPQSAVHRCDARERERDHPGRPVGHRQLRRQTPGGPPKHLSLLPAPPGDTAVTAPPVDVHTYYRQVTDVDIGEIARELLGDRITQESRQTLFCDCPNHRSQSHRSLHVWLDKQGWFCHACGTGGDVLQLVEFVRFGVVTRGQSGSMPDSHRQARDFLAARVRLPPLSKLASGSPEEAEEAHQLTLRVREALTAFADVYHQRLVGNPEVLAWFRGKYGISEETISRLQIGYAENGVPSVARTLMDGPGAFTMRELAATSVFRPTAQDGLVPFFDGRIVFPYWSRGHVVFMIGRSTPWTPDHEWEKSKYKKLAIHNDRNNSHVSPYIRNDVLYNEDVLLARPERVIITEGVTDCISLMEHGFPVVSPVTVQIREADWERLLPKLAGVKTVYICQDNEISEAGMQGALKTARILAQHGIATRVAVLPLGEKQQAAREKLAGLHGGSAEADDLLADAKIDVNEFFASGKTAADFEAILAAAQTPLELAISKLNTEIPDADLSRLLEPILSEVGRLDPIEQDRHLRLIQTRCGKVRMPVTTLRKQLKVVEIARPRRSAPDWCIQ